jgi:hypothetical protein
LAALAFGHLPEIAMDVKDRIAKALDNFHVHVSEQLQLHLLQFIKIPSDLGRVSGGWSQHH